MGILVPHSEGVARSDSFIESAPADCATLRPVRRAFASSGLRPFWAHDKVTHADHCSAHLARVR